MNSVTASERQDKNCIIFETRRMKIIEQVTASIRTELIQTYTNYIMQGTIYNRM